MALPGIVIQIGADTRDAVKGINKVDKALEQNLSSADKTRKAFAAMKPALIAAGAAAAAMAAKFAYDGIQSAANLGEAVNKANVIFGDASKTIHEFTKTANSALALTVEEATDAASTFGGFGKMAGLVGEDLAAFSTDLVTLATDLASFNNTTTDEAVNALGAALRGESEPLRRFNVLLDDATLKQKAMEMRIYDGNGALNAQQKILAAQQVILEQTGDAQGDFERTSDSLVNVQKRLGKTVDDLKTAFGVGFLNALEGTDAAMGPEGLLGAIESLKPALEALGGYVGRQVESIGKLITNIQVVVGWFETLEETIGEDSPLAKAFQFISKWIAITTGEGLGLIGMFNKLIELLQRVDSFSFSNINLGALLPSLGGRSGVTTPAPSLSTRSVMPTAASRITGATISEQAMAQALARFIANSDARAGVNRTPVLA